jgi:hypothetical protein
MFQCAEMGTLQALFAVSTQSKGVGKSTLVFLSIFFSRSFHILTVFHPGDILGKGPCRSIKFVSKNSN